MRRHLARTISFAIAVNGSVALAQSQPEVIARSTPQPAPVAPVTYRAQKEDKPAAPPVIMDSATVPLPGPTPVGPTMSSPPPLPPGAVLTTVPSSGCGVPTYTGPVGPLPTGVFNGGAACGNRWYISGEYLYWWVRDGGLPALVTTGPITDPVPGVLEPTVIGRNTQVTFGNGSLDTQGRSGARFEFGRWFGACQPWAIEGGFFFLGQRTTAFNASGDGSATSPVIARPFFEANRQLETVEYVNFPGVLRGSIAIQSTSNFYGANIDWRRKLWCNPCFRMDGQLGFRYLNLDEDLDIRENSTFVAGGFTTNTGTTIPIGSTSAVQDAFSVDNDFYGVMMGLVSQWRRGPWSVDLLTRVSLGTTHQTVTIAGGQQVVPASLAPPGNFNGGLLARPSNIGTFDTNAFTVVPEVGLNVGYQFTPHWKVFAGYTFMYWSNVARVGDQVDRTINLSGIPFALQPGQRDNLGRVIPAGETRPLPTNRDTDFWAQGVNVGLQWTW